MSNIECPWCDAHQVSEFFIELEDGDEEETECEVCNEPILAYRDDDMVYLYKLE